MNRVDCETEVANAYAQRLRVREHDLRADLAPPDSGDTAPGAHDYFDAALAACKTLTATWYARHKGIPLERVESHVERDASEERKGVYRLHVRLAFHGAQLTAEHRAALERAVSACPVHKLMTTTEIVIDTVVDAG